jgi:uncharacterized membrane protein YkvA (DUF1232 family)
MNPIELYQKILNNPKTRYWVIAFTVIYLFSPFDIIPDFLFPFGYIDDAALVSLMIAELFKLRSTGRKNSKKNNDL